MSMYTICSMQSSPQYSHPITRDVGKYRAGQAAFLTLAASHEVILPRPPSCESQGRSMRNCLLLKLGLIQKSKPPPEDQNSSMIERRPQKCTNWQGAIANQYLMSNWLSSALTHEFINSIQVPLSVNLSVSSIPSQGNGT